MKAVKFIIVWCVAMYVIMSFVSRFGMFEVIDTAGKRVSLFPFSTENTVKARAVKECGEACIVRRVKTN